MNILVVGGAGYIGSHMCKCLAQSGFQPIVLDNLVRGHDEAVQWGPLVKGSLDDADLLTHLFKTHGIAAVMHFAAFTYVGESVLDPAVYYQNNVAATLSLLRFMIEADVKKFIFSSSCAVYGEPMQTPIGEDHPLNPISPYGRTKRMVEEILADFGKAYGLASAALRYFNAAGADPDGQLGEDHDPETHLIPLVMQAALGRKEDIKVFGDDYETDDGTCIRDYIHINDLASAHLLALERLLNGHAGGVYNLGNGNGYSVMEVIDKARHVTGKSIPFELTERREGDPAVLVGSSEKAMNELGWKPQYTDLGTIIEHAWNWHKNHPEGYRRTI
jgi:UDP-glucose 4-epimerase